MHWHMRSVTASLVLAVMLAIAMGGAVLAAPPHEHHIVTPSGQDVAINPAVCNKIEQLHEPVLHNLHAHFHLGAPTAAFATNPITFYAVSPCP